MSLSSSQSHRSSATETAATLALAEPAADEPLFQSFSESLPENSPPLPTRRRSFLGVGWLTSAPWWPYVRPLWVLSLVLHVGALWIPLGQKEAPKPAAAVKSVKVTKIAVPNKPKLQRPKKSKLTVRPKPKLVARAVPPAVVLPRPKAKTLSPVVAKKAPKAAPPPVPETEAPNEGGLDLPLYPNAQPGCNEACLQTSDVLAQVAAFFEKALPAKKWKSEVIESSATRKVLRIAKDNVTQYLSILTTDSPPGTAYVAADRPKTQADLKTSVAVPQEVSDILSNVSAQDVDASATAQPASFSNAAKILSMSFLEGDTPDTVFDTYFSTNLRNNNYEVIPSAQGSYGGGPLYEIKRDKFKGYLNFVADKDGKGTVIVIWKAAPP